MTAPVLELRGISKRFGPVEALRGADFVLHAAEVHALLGENGAGKSTLMHVAFGLVQPDVGSVLVRGRPARVASPNEARALGIGMVHQHFTSVPTLSVEENLRLAAGRGRHGRRPAPADGRRDGGGEASAPRPGAGPAPRPIGTAEQLERVREALAAGLPAAALVEDLTVGQKQRLEILQALAAEADILLLDEPTAVLAPSEARELLSLLRDFRAGGGSVVFITHKLDEAFAIADRVTVLRRGEVMRTGPVAGENRASVARAMIGEVPAAATLAAGPRPAADGSGAVRVVYPLEPSGSQPGAGGQTLEVRGGELLGVAAVEGNGERAFLRALAGLGGLPPGARVTPPVAFIPEDRTTEGLIPSFSLTENLVLGLQDDWRWRHGIWVQWPAARARMGELLVEFGIQAPGPDVPARTLSGGNQQKLVFARAVEGSPAVVVAENPTRGLDARATAFVHQRLRSLAAEGVAVVVHSSDLDEVLGLATRVMVMRRGRLYEAGPGAGRDEVGAMMLGGEP